MSYQCSNCAEVFNDNTAAYHTILEPHWWLDGCPMEELTFMACPECGCEDFEEVWEDDEES